MESVDTEATTVVLGIPIPSTDPLFLTIVAIHVAFGIAAVVAGGVVLLSQKGRGRHARVGLIYFWCLFGVFVTMSLLSVMRWKENYDLFILGALAFGAAYLGRRVAGRYQPKALRLHVASMGISYILMLTAFYVDNGKNLPLWRELPQIAFWLLPSLVGVPILLYALLRHPLINAVSRSATTQAADVQ